MKSHVFLSLGTEAQQPGYQDFEMLAHRLDAKVQVGPGTREVGGAIQGVQQGVQQGIKIQAIFEFLLFFNGILMPFWGFNYSKMANYRFLIDSNTFWMDSGTSKILSKSGPVALPIIMKLHKKIQENYWNNIGEYGFGKSENLKISNFSEVLCT